VSTAVAGLVFRANRCKKSRQKCAAIFS